MKNAIWFISALFVFVAQAEADTRQQTTPVAKFISQVKFSFLSCHLKAETAAMKGTVDTECAEEQRKKIKPIYMSAAKSLQSNKAALSALKDLYSYWVGTITTLPPSADESRARYSARMKEKEAGLEQRILRLEIEIGGP